jgi:hypothetical protein
MKTALPNTFATAPLNAKSKKAAVEVLNLWCGSRTWARLAFLLPLLFMIGVMQAQVTNIIYQDNFARVGPLDGSAPDTVNASNATWTACNVPGLNAQLQTDGSQIALTNVPGTTNLYLNGFLPFAPQVGHLYILSCKVSALSGDTNFLAMGFAVNPSITGSYRTVPVGAGCMLIRGNGTGVQPHRFPGGSGNVAIKAATLGNTTNLFTVVLDTTTGTGTARGWTYRFYTNSVQVDAYATANVNATMIHYVGIGSEGAQGNFQQFTLTDVLMRQGAPTVIEQPQNRTAQVGQTATFWVGVTNDYPTAAYQWMTTSGGGPANPIVGATNATYTTPALDASYNGLSYSVAISNVNGSVTSDSATLAVVSGPPTVYSVTKTANATSIVVAFSKAVDPVTGLNPANYTLTPGASVVSASYGNSSNNVILTTSTLDPNTAYALKVQNVQDQFSNAMTSSSQVVLPAGLVLFLRGDSGVVLDANNNVVQWLDQTTNRNDASQFFGVPSVGLTGSAARPGTSIFNNGQTALDFGNLGSGANLLHFLQTRSSPSLDSVSTNTTMYAVAQFYSTAGNELFGKTWGNLPAPFDWVPAGGETVQYGNGFNNAPAGGIGGTILINTPYVLASTLSFPPENGLATNNFNFYLNGANNGAGSIRPVTGNPPGVYNGGTPIWIGGRSDMQAANPKMRGQIAEIMLFNRALSDADRTIVDNYLGVKYFTFAITTDLPSSTTSSNGFSVNYTFVAGAGSAHGFSLQWQKNGVNIPDATNSTYTTPILSPGDNGTKFDVQVTLPDGSFVYSTTNTLTVLTVPPFVTLTGIPIWNTNQVIVTFDEAIDPATATVAANYSLNNGASVLSAAMDDLSNKVVLTTSPLTFNANPGFYTLAIQNVKDLFGLTMNAASTPVGLYPNAALWVRADTGVTTDASGVTSWTDLSGNNNTIYGGGGPTIQPQLATNAVGDPIIRFNTTDTVTNYMTTAGGSPSLAITGDISIIAVVNPRVLNGRSGHIASKTGTLNKNIGAPYDFYLGTPAAQLYRGNGNGTVAGINYGSFPATTGPSIGNTSVVIASDTGNTVSQYLNGQPAGTGLLSASFKESDSFDQGEPLYIGARSDFVNRLAGDLSELIVAASPLSASDAANLSSYLSAQHHFTLFNPNPTALTVSYSNNQLSLTWPADHTGWQVQSNSVGVEVTNAWFTVSGSTSTNQLTITPDANQTHVFYRMFFQQP